MSCISILTHVSAQVSARHYVHLNVYNAIRGQNRASSSLEEDLYMVVIPTLKVLGTKPRSLERAQVHCALQLPSLKDPQSLKHPGTV